MQSKFCVLCVLGWWVTDNFVRNSKDAFCCLFSLSLHTFLLFFIFSLKLSSLTVHPFLCLCLYLRSKNGWMWTVLMESLIKKNTNCKLCPNWPRPPPSKWKLFSKSFLTIFFLNQNHFFQSIELFINHRFKKYAHFETCNFQ